MKKQTIKKINRLNKDFYKKVFRPFDQTRSKPWQGWQKLKTPILYLSHHTEKLKVLDIGCGNGRFYAFIQSILDSEMLNFTGIDSSKELLQIAKELYPEGEFVQKDIVTSLLGDKEQDSSKYDLITLFGVMHHIPSKELRSKLTLECLNSLKCNGILVIANWQFADEERYQKRCIKPETVDIKADELETNDYILDWQKGERAYRFCHHTTDEEMKEILTKTNGVLMHSFFADGKSGKLNKYYVIKRRYITTMSS